MTARRIHIKGPYREDEATVGESGIYPGMLLDTNSAGSIIKHATEGARAERLVALENALAGDTVSTVFTSGEKRQYGVIAPGTEVYLMLEDGADVVINDELISSGNGKVKKRDDASGVTVYQTIARAREAKDLTLSGTTDTLIKCRMV